ncbi:MAG TPA: hypothetical protein VL944_01085 [Candidatus Acidoferrum sp.]|nr:hypothetical protein [Candidatus Acidoferrum sp.]
MVAVARPEGVAKEQNGFRILISGAPVAAVMNGEWVTITPFVGQVREMFGVGYRASNGEGFTFNAISPWEPLTAYRAMRLLEESNREKVDRSTPDKYMKLARGPKGKTPDIKIPDDFVDYLKEVLDLHKERGYGRVNLEEVEGAIAAGRIKPSMPLYRMIAGYYIDQFDQMPTYQRSRQDYEHELGGATPKIPVWDIITTLIEGKRERKEISVQTGETVIVETTSGAKIPFGNAKLVRIEKEEPEIPLHVMDQDIKAPVKAAFLRKLAEETTKT